MTAKAVSLQIVGANYPNKRGGNRKFEIAVTPRGEAVTFEAEPNNPADRNAVKVMSVRGIQIGYVVADRTRIIRDAIRDKREIRAVFQNAFPGGCWVRVAFDGEEPELPPDDTFHIRKSDAGLVVTGKGDPDAGFWPDEEYPDE